MIIKKLLILANSRKQAGRCIAGICLDAENYGTWIRPVSARPEDSLNPLERQYQDKSEPLPLDIVDIPLVRPNPCGCHTENWFVSTRKYWKKRGEMMWSEAMQFAKNPVKIWENGQSTYHGLNNEVPTEVAKNFSNSIGLIHTENLTIEPKIDYNNRKKIYASFIHNECKYRFSVTDVAAEDFLLNNCDTNQSIGECLLTISLSEPFRKNNGEEHQYKLIAAIIQRPIK